MPDTSALQSHFYVILDGQEAPAELTRDIERITVETSLHLPDVATLVVHDPRLRWVDGSQLEPGTALQVIAKTGASQETLFDGEIVEIEPDFGSAVQRLVVRAFDRLHRLARGSHVRSFINVTDSDLFRRLAQEAGLEVRTSGTRQVHPYLLQANETNLAFLQRRAASLGYLLYAEGTRLCCEAPDTSGRALELNWGQTLYEFHPRLTTVGQVNRVVARGWDPQAKHAIFGEARDSQTVPRVGNQQSGGTIAQQAFDLRDVQLLVADRPVRTQAAADLLAQAVADRVGGRFIEADGVCTGMPGLVAGVPLTIYGVGERFSGAYFVTSATHSSGLDSGYRTTFTISGLNPATIVSLLAPQPEVVPTNSLVIGVVTDNNDPDGQGRVKVLFPWLSSDNASNWARVVSVGGGPQRGIQFLPEVDDEVLVGFEMGDINYPYVLGGLWNGIDAPPDPSAAHDGRVERRMLRTRTGHTLVFDDSHGTSGITVEDTAGNQVHLDAMNKSLSITAKGDIQISADGSITIQGKGIVIDGGQGVVDIDGSTIELN